MRDLYYGRIDARDIDRLFTAIRSGSDDPAFDLDQDSQVERSDMDLLVREILRTEYGDVNLDGHIGLDNFRVVRSNFGEEVAGWGEGDLDGDSVAGLTDFLLLKSNFGFFRDD